MPIQPAKLPNPRAPPWQVHGQNCWRAKGSACQESLVLVQSHVPLMQTNSICCWEFLARSKDSFEALQSIATVAAISIGALWTYMLFVKRRERYPRADLKQRVEFWAVSETQRVLRVALIIENKSQVLLRVTKGSTWIQQMKPWPTEAIEARAAAQAEPLAGGKTPPAEVGWPIIAEQAHSSDREIEPGEIDEVTMDFVIGTDCEQLLIYSYLENSSKPDRNIGWSASTILDLCKASGNVVQQVQGQAMEKPRPSVSEVNSKEE